MGRLHLDGENGGLTAGELKERRTYFFSRNQKKGKKKTLSQKIRAKGAKNSKGKAVRKLKIDSEQSP